MSKVAIVHDWLTGLRGGERVLLEFLKIYPNADIFTLVHSKGATSQIIDQQVKQQSFIGALPYASKLYRYFLPIYPLAFGSLNLSGYDLVISLSHAGAKNVKVPKNCQHLCYCFTPMRYIWDQADTYFGNYKNLMFPLLNYLQIWDINGAKSVDKFSVISKFVGARVRKYYHRKAEVIHPPISTEWIKPISKYKRGDAFLYAGALVPYKRPDLVIEAFNALQYPLVVAGNGPMINTLKERAGKNIIFFENPTDEQLAELYRTSRALVFPAIEDFGMIPVECMSAGRPVIGIGRGGLKESLIGINAEQGMLNTLNQATGVFISGRGVLLQKLINGVKFFETIEEQLRPESCIAQAKKFSPLVFKEKWHNFTDTN